MIQPTPLSLSKPAKVLFDKNDLVNPNELWRLAYANLEDPIHKVITLLLQKHGQHPIFCKLRLSMADCQLKHCQLFYRNRMYIPDHHEFCLHLIHQANISPLKGHSGKSRTFEMLSRHYFCSRLAQLVRRFVQNCKNAQGLKH